MDEEILIRYGEGTLSEAERAAVVSWLESDLAHFEQYAALQLADTFRGLDQAPLTEKEAASRLAAPVWPPAAARKRAFPWWLNLISRVAALLLLPLAVAALLVISRQNDRIEHLTAASQLAVVAPIQQDASWLYTVNPGVKGDITLPDGSRVRLNSASTLRCPDRFAAESRVVELSGEGFFDVVGNPDWPLYVKTPKGVTVKVTGTKFNISAYADDTSMKLTLVEGNVTLIHEATDRHYVVRPNEELVFMGGAKTGPLKKTVDVQPAIVWKDGILHFENTRMDEVVRRLERWYGVAISVQDPTILEMSFTASFESESISQVLQLLKITSQIDYRISGRSVTLSRK